MALLNQVATGKGSSAQVEWHPGSDLEGTGGAVFELPVWAISFMTRKRKGNPNAAEHLAKGRAARELPAVSTKSDAEAA